MPNQTECPELFRNPGLEEHFESHRFHMLHPDGRRLVAHWFALAQEQVHCDPAESFEPFIFAWIAFNGWASCCTELDQDRQLIEAVSSSPELSSQFEESLQETGFRLIAERFRDQWPVFKAQELKRLGALTYWHENRQRTIAHYIGRGAKTVAPACYRRHVDAGEKIPLDWPHVLAAIYQVRCNLFHGDKAPHSEIDRTLVHCGFQILVRFLSRWGYMP